MTISRMATVSESSERTSRDTLIAPSVNALGVLKPCGFPTIKLDSDAVPEKGETFTLPSLPSLVGAWGPYVSPADRITRLSERYRNTSPPTISTTTMTPISMSLFTVFPLHRCGLFGQMRTALRREEVCANIPGSASVCQTRTKVGVESRVLARPAGQGSGLSARARRKCTRLVIRGIGVRRIPRGGFVEGARPQTSRCAMPLEPAALSATRGRGPLADGDAVLVAVVDLRDHLLLEHPVECLRVAGPLNRGVGVLTAAADGEAVQSIGRLRPPAVAERTGQPAVQQHLLPARAAGLLGMLGRIEPEVHTLHQVARHPHIIVLDEGNSRPEPRVPHQLADLLDEPLAFMVLWMGLAREDDLGRSIRVIEDSVEAPQI